MFGFIARVIGVAVLILVGFVLYQKYLDPSVTNADLIKGASDVGNKVIELGKGVADSAFSGQKKTIVGNSEDYFHDSEKISTRPTNRLPVQDDCWGQEYVTDSLTDIEPPSLGQKHETVNDIIRKYKDLNLLLEEDER